MRLATWNIYWLGDREDHILRTESDHQLIAEVIRKLSPDVLALEEIVDPLVMEHIQKLFLCINKQTIDFIQGSAIRGGPGGRRPYAARLRERSSGKEFVVAGLHLRSGYPVFLDKEDAAVRKEEVAAQRNTTEAASKKISDRACDRPLETRSQNGTNLLDVNRR